MTESSGYTQFNYHIRDWLSILLIQGYTYRSKRVNIRKEFGHFEANTIVLCLTKGVILVLLERKTRIVKTITYDNGTENMNHILVNIALDCESYFCNPYHSWEKGSVEHAVGLVRGFIPKSSNFKGIWDKTIEDVETLLNNRPRKCLGYLTPAEVFQKELNVAL